MNHYSSALRLPYIIRLTYTVYKEKTTETIPPVVPVWKVFWKCGMAMIAVIKEPSYPLAQAQQKATKTESVL